MHIIHKTPGTHHIALGFDEAGELTMADTIRREAARISAGYVPHQDRVAMAMRILSSFDHPNGARNYELVEQLEALHKAVAAKLQDVKKKNWEAQEYLRGMVDHMAEAAAE